jgi:hypothetical protein
MVNYVFKYYITSNLYFIKYYITSNLYFIKYYIIIVNMKNVLGYFSDINGNPISYMDRSGLIIFSSKKSLKTTKSLGSYSEMNRILSNIDYYTLRQRGQRGSGGLFGESDGSCGWGSDPSCCFFSCQPLWRTSLWPISDAVM